MWKTRHAIRDADRVREDVVTTMHLFNARTRLVGLNQCLTTYKRHADAAWEDHVRAPTFKQYMAIARERVATGSFLTSL